MKVTYKGMPQALPPKVQQKLDGKFAKIAKLLDGRGEREAHVIVTQERRMCCAEITLQFHDHKLIGKGSDTDLFTALSMALEKLDSQAVKQRTKWRAAHRHKDDGMRRSAEAEAPVKVPASPAPQGASEAQEKRIFRVNGAGRRKPMTLDEAILEMDETRDYLVYRDADRDAQRQGLSILVRRRDGHFDLIES
ncbi:MAG TPA: HPF/RaiA family ribosome-associated protein [Bryobacteraceae bacterium]|jgi:putative sigma-54 modulation protein|nr:HPF/RaiA family ribosome-associated protein [Bryobacteraceae bacterium]